MKTIRIKDYDATKKRDFLKQEFYEAKRGAQEERVAKIVDKAVDDIADFVKRTITMGGEYESKNNFSFTQKQKILSYIYFKNNHDLQKSRMFTYLNVKAGNTKESIQNRIDHLNEMKDYNRAFFIYNLARCQNRLRNTGYIWGSVIAAGVWNTVMSQSTLIRKVAVAAMIIHISGQFASYKNIDRVFDGIYPIFYKDFRENLEREEKEKAEEFNPDNLARDNEITAMMKEQIYNPARAKKRHEEGRLYKDDL